MPNVTYKGRKIKLPYTRKGYRIARKLIRQSRYSLSAFSAGDGVPSALRQIKKPKKTFR